MAPSPAKASGFRPWWIFITRVASQATTRCGEDGDGAGAERLNTAHQRRGVGELLGTKAQPVVPQQSGHNNTTSRVTASPLESQHQLTDNTIRSHIIISSRVTTLPAVTTPPPVGSQHRQYGHSSTSEVTATLRCLTRFHG